MKVTWPKKSTMPARPMGNLLRPVGIPWASYRRDLEGLNQTTVIRHIPDSRQDPMPSRVGDLIRTPKGVQPVFSDTRGLGIPLGISKSHLNERRHLLRPVVIPWSSYRRDMAGSKTTEIRHFPDSRQVPMRLTDTQQY